MNKKFKEKYKNMKMDMGLHDMMHTDHDMMHK